MAINYLHIEKTADVQVQPEKPIDEILTAIVHFQKNQTDSSYLQVYDTINRWAVGNRFNTFEHFVLGYSATQTTSLSEFLLHIKEPEYAEEFASSLMRMHEATSTAMPVFEADLDIRKHPNRMYYRIIDGRDFATNFTSGFPFSLDKFTRNEITPEEVEATLNFCSQLGEDLIRTEIKGVNPLPIAAEDGTQYQIPSYWHLGAYYLPRLLSHNVLDIAADLKEIAQKKDLPEVELFTLNLVKIQTAFMEKLMSKNPQERRKMETIIIGSNNNELDNWAEFMLHLSEEQQIIIQKECRALDKKKAAYLASKIEELEEKQKYPSSVANLDILASKFATSPKKTLRTCSTIAEDCGHEEEAIFLRTHIPLHYKDVSTLPFFKELGIDTFSLEKRLDGNILVVLSGSDSFNISLNFDELKALASKNNLGAVVLTSLVQASIVDTLNLDKMKSDTRVFLSSAKQILSGASLDSKQLKTIQDERLFILYELVHSKSSEYQSELKKEALAIVEQIENLSKFLSKTEESIVRQIACLVLPTQKIIPIYKATSATEIYINQTEGTIDFSVKQDSESPVHVYSVTAQELNASKMLYLHGELMA